jgi:transposase
LVRQLGVGQRKVKNDRRDAQVLAVASGRNGDSLPHVHVPSSASRQLRRVLAARSSLVSCRAKQVTAAKSLLRQELVLLPTGTTAAFPQRARTALDGSTLLDVIEPMLQAIESLTLSIALCDQQVEALCADDAQVKLLKTVPGIGPVIAAMVLAVIDEPGRFDKGAQLASYVGLTPGENTTGGKRRLTGITRAGQGQMRTLLIQACWTLIRTMPDCALAKRYARMSLHKPKQVAIVATARKLSVVIHAMLHKHQPFNPTLGATTPKDAKGQASVQEQLAEALRT